MKARALYDYVIDKHALHKRQGNNGYGDGPFTACDALKWALQLKFILWFISPWPDRQDTITIFAVGASIPIRSRTKGGIRWVDHCWAEFLCRGEMVAC